MTGYTGFSEETEEQEGNFLALKIEADEDATITAEFVGGEAVEIGEDRFLVARITNKDTQTLKVTATKGATREESFTFSLSGLTLETEA